MLACSGTPAYDLSYQGSRGDGRYEERQISVYIFGI
jgi:hypothetical protein